MNKFFQGTIRPKIKPLEPDLQSGFFMLEIEWVEMGTNKTIWTETVKIPPNNAAFSQIEVTGYAKPVDGIFVDENGKRHYVMRVDPGSLGVPFG